jgi:hypothetical protein
VADGTRRGSGSTLAAWQLPPPASLDTNSRREVVQASIFAGGAALARTAFKQARLRGGGSGGGASMTIIDSAVHVWKTDPLYPWAKEAASNPPGKDASAEELIELMDAHQVDKTVIVQPICYRFDNSYVKDTISKWPTRFAAVARVDPEDENAATRLEQLTQAGFKGCRFGPVEEAWWTSDNMLRILKKVSLPLFSRKWIVHVGPMNSGKTYHALQSVAASESGAYCGPLRLLAWEVFWSIICLYD